MLEVPAGCVSSEALFLGFRMTSLPLYLHMVLSLCTPPGVSEFPQENRQIELEPTPAISVGAY